MTVQGYMIEVDWDGHTLRVHGTNKASRVALAGEDHAQDVILTREQITSVQLKRANPVVNGNLIVHTVEGRKYQLHFRRKSNDEFARLAGELTN